MQKKTIIFFKNILAQYIVLIIVLVAYFFIYFYDRSIFILALDKVWQILQEVLPTLVAVFVLFSISNYLFSSNSLIKNFARNSFAKWAFVILGGILSSGPIYMWYPLMADLKGKFLNDGMIACFIYNRAIKIPLLPVMIVYFGAKYVIILFVTMVFASLVQGYVINKLIKEV